MKVRAAIFDVYKTLLRVDVPASDPGERWRQLCQDFFHVPPQLTWPEFLSAGNEIIARQHALARERGITFPEILWPRIVSEVLPEFSRLEPHLQEEFVFQQMQVGRSVSLQSGAGDALKLLRERQCVLGIASNAQAYTLRELRESLAQAGLDLGVFKRELCFWSFENGFSKPDPHVFRILAARLEAREILPEETVVVGDRLDNDIGPAQTQGFLTWHLHIAPETKPGAGDWSRFLHEIERDN